MVVTPINGSGAVDTVYSELLNYGVPAYFTGVTKNNDYIECTTANGTALNFHVDAQQDYYGNWNVYINYVSIYGSSHTDNYTKLTSIIRTQHGLILTTATTIDETEVTAPYIIITKDNSDDTVIFAHPAGGYGVLDMTEFVCVDDAAATYTLRDCEYSTDTVLLTTLVPVICEANMKYCPNLKWVVQRQYNLVGEIAFGEHHYWTDGQIALLDI